MLSSSAFCRTVRKSAQSRSITTLLLFSSVLSAYYHYICFSFESESEWCTSYGANIHCYIRRMVCAHVIECLSRRSGG